MKINYKKLFLIIVLTILIGSFFSFFTSTDIYDEIIRPPLSPPGILFPIVWFTLYTIMGISLYIVLESKGDIEGPTIIYIIQLVVNSLWTLLFFGLKNFLISTIGIFLLIVLVIIMIIKFYRINKTAGLIQIPYLLWISFAFYLNLSIYLLNK